jgi:hypothetical protein
MWSQIGGQLFILTICLRIFCIWILWQIFSSPLLSVSCFSRILLCCNHLRGISFNCLQQRKVLQLCLCIQQEWLKSNVICADYSSFYRVQKCIVFCTVHLKCTEIK